MSRWVGPRSQIVLVVLLFAGALCILLYNLVTTLGLPRQELDVRASLRDAGRQMSEAAAAQLAANPEGERAPADLNRALRAVTERVLADFPGVEGGFQVGGAFAGYAYPTSSHVPPQGYLRNDPPPREAPVILAQLGVAVEQGEAILRTQDVGPSRVVILAEPVEAPGQGRCAVWLMYRLTGPKDLKRQLQLTSASTGLALAGVALALFLTWRLSRSLRQQRDAQARLQDELRQAEHLAGLGKLLAGVAHEVRNPLAAIRSTVQLWQRLPEAARQPGTLDSVLAAVDRLNALVGRLLFFARADNACREPVDLNRLLTETLDLLRAQAAEQGVTLETDFAPDLPAALGSAAALRQVALNLLANALQAMPAGGRLRCTTRRLLERRALEVRVADTGPGVPAAARPHLFEPFFTTRPAGTGLGLALCREILNNHGGQVELLDAEGPGAVFRFVLPIAPRDAVGNAASGGQGTSA